MWSPRVLNYYLRIDTASPSLEHAPPRRGAPAACSRPAARLLPSRPPSVAHWTRVGSVLFDSRSPIVTGFCAYILTRSRLEYYVDSEVKIVICAVKLPFTVRDFCKLLITFTYRSVCERLFLCWFMRSGVLEIDRFARRRIPPSSLPGFL